MDLYSAKIRLAGSLDNEVIKHDLTPAEIHLLNNLHAGQHPGVVDIKKTGSTTRTDMAERKRLAAEYTKGELVEDRGSKLVTALFGVAGVALPQTYVAPVVEQNDQTTEEDEKEVITRIGDPVPSKAAKATAADLIG